MTARAERRAGVRAPISARGISSMHKAVSDVEAHTISSSKDHGNTMCADTERTEAMTNLARAAAAERNQCGSLPMVILPTVTQLSS